MIGQYNTAFSAQVWIQEAKATVPTYSKNRKKRMLYSSHIERSVHATPIPCYTIPSSTIPSVSTAEVIQALPLRCLLCPAYNLNVGLS